MWIEQTEIARKKLGISMNAFHRMLRASGYEIEKNYRLINNKRHYDYDKILELIKNNLAFWPKK